MGKKSDMPWPDCASPGVTSWAGESSWPIWCAPPYFFSQLIAKLGLYNTYWALILIYPTQLIPFVPWLLMGYFRAIPKEIEESAMADGCTRVATLVCIILPPPLPRLLPAGIFCFTLCWNEFLYALIFMSSGPMKTIPWGP